MKHPPGMKGRATCSPGGDTRETAEGREAGIPPLHLVELEFVRRHLTQAVVGACIQEVEVREGLPCNVPSAILGERLRGETVLRVDRRGRQLSLRVGGKVVGIVVQPGAAVRVGPARGSAPERPWLGLSMGACRVWWHGARACLAVTLEEVGEEAASAASERGVEPLSAAFTLGAFKRILQNKKRTIRQLLVDDELIAGVGDLYADEVLFAARLRPTRAVPSLGEDEIRFLYYSILEVLQKAIRFGGVGAEGAALVEGHAGTFSRFIAVHGREAQECPACRTRIRAVANRTARIFFCPRCQK